MPLGAPPRSSACRAELTAAAERGLTDEELIRAKGQNRGALVLGLEDPLSRTPRLGKAELVDGELPPLDELLGPLRAG